CFRIRLSRCRYLKPKVAFRSVADIIRFQSDLGKMSVRYVEHWNYCQNSPVVCRFIQAYLNCLDVNRIWTSVKFVLKRALWVLLLIGKTRLGAWFISMASIVL
ncbi:unnamed protein product, partial [Hymenolepis diminuta]